MAIGGVQASRVFHNLEDIIHVNGLLQESRIISREALLDMSRGGLKLYLSHGPSQDNLYVHNVQTLWQALLATMQDSSVVEAHMTATCNAICVFLQSASSSPFLPIQTFAMSVEIWMVVFDTLLEKFHCGKPKSLRQVLNTLIKILAQREDSIRVRSIRRNVLSRMADIILLGKPVSYLKASMVIFEAFTRSGVPVSSTLSAIGRSHGSNYGQWDQYMKQRGFDIAELRTAANCQVVDESIYCFGLSVILAIVDSNVQTTVGTFVTSLMAMLTDYEVSLDSFWVELIVTALRRYPKAIDAFKNYLLPSVFELQSSHFHRLLRSLASEDAGFSMLQNALAITILGRDRGFVSEKDIASILSTKIGEGQEPLIQRDNGSVDETKLYATLLTHASAGVRIRSYDLLATSRGRAKSIRSSVLSTLSRNFVYFHGNSDPASREQTNSITAAMITRLRQGKTLYTTGLARPGLTDQQYDEYNRDIKQHEQFLDWLLGFLEDDLSPNCSFPRQISSLKALQSTLGQGFTLQSFRKPLGYQNMKFALWHLLLDPFEETRATALPILKSLLEIEGSEGNVHEYSLVSRLKAMSSIESLSLEPAAKSKQPASCRDEEIARVAEEANKLAALTNRADHTDGAGRLMLLQHLFSPKKRLILSDVLEQLDRALGLDEIDISFSKPEFSLHGYLIGLKYIVEFFGLQKTHGHGIVLNGTNVTVHQLLNVCKSVWQAVRGDLCVDSPELSRDVDATGRFDGPKDFLSYSWRALRDSSLLIQAILLQVGNQVHEILVNNSTVAHLRAVYALCFEQLTALRHRGAFSTVAQTFALCCERFARVPSLRAEFKNRYQEASQILEDQSSKVTRRSAGIPAIVSGLLIPSTSDDFNAGVAAFASIAKLKKISNPSATVEQQVRLPQVHALNCLREIFTDSRFKSRISCWLVGVLDIAASSLTDQVWAVRNCGLMLFRACASHIGTAAGIDGYDTDEFRYLDRSEATLSIAFRLLDSGRQSDSDCFELHFAGLDLLSRILVPRNVESQTRERIIAQLRSPVWMIREHAARVYASKLPETETLEAATSLIGSMAFNDQNRCHGILLCSYHLLKKYAKALLPGADASRLAFEQTLRGCAPSIESHAAPSVRYAFMSILNECATLHLRIPTQLQTSLWRKHFYGRDKGSEHGSRMDCRRSFDAQLQSSLALSGSLAILAGQEMTRTTLPEIFQNIALYDLDATAGLLRALTDQVLGGQYSLRLVADFYADVVQNNYSEDITTAALLGISECFEKSLGSTELIMADRKLGSLIEKTANLSCTGSRNCFDARVRALGCLLAYKSEKGEPIWNHLPSRPLTLWVEMLSVAAKDPTEALTRLHAAKSLHSFKGCLVEPCDRHGLHRKLVPFSILYDFLNDDDEEIRDLAATTASFILTAATTGVKLLLCPLAACHQLSEHLGQIYSDKGEFHVTTFCRLMFSITIETYDLDEFAALASHYSVKRQLDLARYESYDLFEEERQNLYLDSVREIYVWHSVLVKIPRTWIKDGALLTVGAWALEGLRELGAALPSLGTGLFSVLSKVEIITLFVRVIKMADLLRCWEYSCYFGPEPLQKSAYQIQMERLLYHARTHPVHPQVEKALEDSVQAGQVDLERLNVQRDELAGMCNQFN